jgi:DNA-binding HxlR family transcriptional regulator
LSLGHTKGTTMNIATPALEAASGSAAGPVDGECPDCKRINEVLTRVGDRWSVLVIISLSEYGTLRFNELKRNLGISQRMLSLTLRELVRDGLVHREQFPTIPPKVEYSLTKMGQSFREPVMALGMWALKNLSKIDTARANYDLDKVG